MVWGQGERSCWRGEVRLLLSEWTERGERLLLSNGPGEPNCWVQHARESVEELSLPA